MFELARGRCFLGLKTSHPSTAVGKMSFPEFPAIPLVGYVRLPGGYPKKMSYENLTATLFNWVSQLFICSTQLLVEQVDVETGNLKMAN